MNRSIRLAIHLIVLLTATACSTQKPRPTVPSDASGVEAGRSEADAALPTSSDRPSIAPGIAPPNATTQRAVPLPDPGNTVFFPLGSTQVLGDADAVLDAMAEKAKRSRSPVLLVGHTDSLGSNEYCVALSVKRIAVIEAALRRRGVPRSQIRRRPMGKDVAGSRGCRTEVCRQAHRSVEILIQVDERDVHESPVR